jgi:peptidoglycan/LPS O-acetylase OafA/YrhL
MTKQNNFDFIRFICAIFVVISHSYDLSGESESYIWINQATHSQFVFAQIGLGGFFVISGYFIFQSLERSQSIFEYFKKRFLRVFPGLLVMLGLTLVLVPFIHIGGIAIFKQWDYYTYLPRNLSLYGFQSMVKGVFQDNQYIAVNGSLWTIRYEFTLYIALAILFYLKKNKKIIQGILCATFIFIYVFFVGYMDRLGNSQLLTFQGYPLFNLSAFFVGGSLLAAFNFEKWVSVSLFWISLVLVVGSLYIEYFALLKHLVFPVLVLCIGFIPLPFISTFGKLGDMSYGIYIYSFPIQQTLVYFFNMNTYTLMINSIVLSIVFGYLSWHLIEKRAMQYKRKFILNTKDEEKLDLGIL